VADRTALKVSDDVLPQSKLLLPLCNTLDLSSNLLMFPADKSPCANWTASLNALQPLKVMITPTAGPMSMLSRTLVTLIYIKPAWQTITKQHTVGLGPNQPGNPKETSGL